MEFRELSRDQLREEAPSDGKTKIRRAELVQQLQAQGYDEEQVEHTLKRLHGEGIVKCTVGKFSDAYLAQPIPASSPTISALEQRIETIGIRSLVRIKGLPNSFVNPTGC